MKVIIAGASGLIGQELTSFLKGKGYEVAPLKRPQDWDPEKGRIDLDRLEGADVIINLAGDSIMGFWTKAKKNRICKSRMDSTRVLVDAIKKLKNPPKLFLNASAIGYFGDSGDQLVNERSAPGSLFLSDVVKNWESIAKEAPCRSVFLRFGVVLSKKGGALKTMLTPFKLGLGGILGSGNQYMSYIALGDLVEAVYHIINHPEISGPVNIVAKDAVTNHDFTKTLGKVLNRPTIFPVPEFIIKNIFGDMGKELFLASERVDPAVLKSTGFKWKSNSLEEALRNELS